MRKLWYCPMIVCLVVSFVALSACSDDSPSGGDSSSSVSDSVSSSTASSGTASSGTASSGTASSGTASSGTASSGTASSAASSSSSGEMDQNYDFDGNIANLRNAITSPTDQAVNMTVTGIVHACKRAGLFWIQDNTAGIYVYKNGGDAPTVGSKITLTATKGVVFRNLKEVTDYTGYSLVSTGNQVYRQTGVPTADKQGQAWMADNIVVSSSWNDKSNITVGGVTYRNDSGAPIAAGTYRIQGPVGQYNNNIQVLVYSDGAIAQGSASSAASSSSSSAVSSSSSSAASANPTGSWAQDGAKPASERPFNNYYGAAYGKTGTALKAALQSIITHTRGVGYGGLYTLYATSDVRDDGKIWDMYSTHADGTSHDGEWGVLGENGTYFTSTKKYYSYAVGQTGSASGMEGNGGYNREHTWPKSNFGGSTSDLPGTDAHHITPTDVKVNSWRGNDSYGEVGSSASSSVNGCKKGPARSGLGYNGTVFEPIDAYKGDHARMHFYMSLRYYNEDQFQDGHWSKAGAKLKAWYDTMLRRWHANDPVSPKEITRNNAIYNSTQHNRNPFIDYPELVDMIDFQN